MVRRRSSKLKASRSNPRPLDKRDARINRWNTLEDIPMDEEDQFHTSKDRILLEGEEAGADDDGDEEEVFALKGIPSSESDADEEDAYEEDDFDENQPHPVSTSKGSNANAKPPPESDDDEGQESEEEESWGRKKSAYYSSNAAELDSEDEEANELEEQEAKRIQAKTRDAMLDDDFGLADINQDDMEVTEDPLLEPAMVVTTQPIPLDKKDALRHLEKTNPETLALANDWEDIAAKVVHTQEKIKELSSTEPDSQTLGMVHLHNQALITYATTLAFYLYLRASEYYSQRPELLRSHPIFARLLQLKQALSTLEELDFHLSESDSGIGDTEDEDSLVSEEGMDGSILPKRYHKGSQLAFDDLAALLREAEEAVASVKTQKETKPTQSRPPKEPPKKKRKTSTVVKPATVFDLEEPTYIPSKHRTSTLTPTSGRTTHKKARRHTLRFHTSKIESASARRQGARLSLGGDDDVPYRERRKGKEARAQREAQAGKRGQGGDDLDGIEPESLVRAMGKVNVDEDDEDAEESVDGYYSLVQRQKREEKESRKLAYEAAKATIREVDSDDTEGPRSLTRAILKNRGLTPRRSKSVRNPRVKKRQKFAKAKKVIASQKPVFKPGAGDSTWYGGEKSGISTVVKSVQF
ncbi:Sas10 C-terminal domain-containing protein [Russula aff. rugulosa BPL654]|nr:Sas10 C-terminal domain-containing protein [Russula aff. rugulosa BPL654]